MKDNKTLILVSGTGRSGTHLVGRTVSSHLEVSGRIEIESTFGLITKIATTQDYKPSWLTYILKIILKRRLKKILNDSNNHILEKSHPSLWLVDFFIKEFNSKFIFVYREVEPTVSSMLEHEGVLGWYDKLPMDKPNRFLGIDKYNSTFFKKYSIEEKCALRWKSHYEAIFHLNKIHPNNTFIVKYDDFLTDPTPIMEKLSEFLGVSNEFEIEKFKTDSLDKWKKKLNEEQLNRIREITFANNK